ncbi:unnamed protein product [Rangifer tarandus platyrhynchus]|uniref:Uncharacterized protein n=2 Tax=Rangifer tarandus platyrhynchus TaxID=3082113 RepID=A0ACB0ELU5_RANTA|nr:unnamed protein product [Rangifer tarandus platyrhynchus]CAI9701702.1 unnamed protein product [Rangifer tarandus platyrhynchus]
MSLVLLNHTEIRGPRHPQKSETFCPPDYQITSAGPPLSFTFGLDCHVGQNDSPRLPVPLVATLTAVRDQTPRTMETMSPLDHTPSGCCPASSSSEMGRTSQPHLSPQD